ncbi:MAG TPA: ribbon-helix-helix domain-containing protein [Candidatus Limnocylindria bacterium]|nr:ribbon-helix-helix domain-containing protein [Candidatus Limnocylindria bacterium]
MKVSISLPDDDLAFLDEYTQKSGLESRSAAVQKAVRLLRTSELSEAYAAAWEEWDSSGDAALWETTVADGLGPR